MRTARESSEGEGKAGGGVQGLPPRAGRGKGARCGPNVHTSPRDRPELVSEKIDPAADLILTSQIESHKRGTF